MKLTRSLHGDIYTIPRPLVLVLPRIRCYKADSCRSPKDSYPPRAVPRNVPSHNTEPSSFIGTYLFQWYAGSDTCWSVFNNSMSDQVIDYSAGNIVAAVYASVCAYGVDSDVVL